MQIPNNTHFEQDHAPSRFRSVSKQNRTSAATVALNTCCKPRHMLIYWTKAFRLSTSGQHPRTRTKRKLQSAHSECIHCVQHKAPVKSNLKYYSVYNVCSNIDFRNCKLFSPWAQHRIFLHASVRYFFTEILALFSPDSSVHKTFPLIFTRSGAVFNFLLRLILRHCLRLECENLRAGGPNLRNSHVFESRRKTVHTVVQRLISQGPHVYTVLRHWW
jgi:hypothetical protein